MIADLLALEHYYGIHKAGLYLDEVEGHYRPDIIRQALRAGHVVVRRILCGPDCGRLFFALSEMGRREAACIRAAQELLSFELRQ